jgi:2-polyprenyl-6-methoxyphenol hydroxylase-like FAD-dependent oxidoreductase
MGRHVVTNTPAVLIVGAGPAGLVLACDLARRGVGFRIVEINHPGNTGSRGKGTQPRTLEVYDDLGVIDAMHAAGGLYPPAMQWDGAKQLGEYRMTQLEQRQPTPHIPYPSMYMIPQVRSMEILRARLKELGGQVEFGTKVNGFTQDADSVTATLQREGGASETVRSRYLVGADGGRGIVRPTTGVEYMSEPVDSRPMITADLVVAGLERTHWHMWDKPKGGSLWLCPLARSDAFQLYAVFNENAPDTSPKGLQQLISERTGRAELKVGEIEWVSIFAPHIGMADHFRVGRVFLAGDAAHVHSPAGGVGMNTSVQDSYNLGWKFGQVLLHGAPDSLLDTYEDERLPVAAHVLNYTTRVHQGMWIDHDKKKVEPRDEENWQLNVNYCDGPLAVDEREDVPSGALRSGHRAPDSPLRDAGGATFRLFDAFRGPHFTLLAIGATGVPRLDSRYGDVVHVYRIVRTRQAAEKGSQLLVDAEGHAHRAYGDGLFLIRPDGYVGYAAPANGGTPGLDRYLARFFA